MESTVNKRIRNTFSFKDIASISETVQNWQPPHEVWPFIYGDDILGSLSMAGGFFMTYFFRKELKIIPYARFTCYFPVITISAMSTKLFHSCFVLDNIVTGNVCPLCLTTKGGIGQAFFGTFFPLLAASATCFYVSERLLTYPIPPLLKAPKEVFYLWQKIFQKNKKPIMISGAVSIMAGMFFTHYKLKCWMNIKTKANK